MWLGNGEIDREPASMTLQSTQLTPRTGSEVHLSKAEMLSGARAEEIRDLLEKRGVLVFRNAHLEDDEMQKFADTIGTVNEEDGEFKVTLEVQQNINAYILYGTRAWHMDRLDTALPPRGTILCPRVLSKTGGETEFANTYAAYDDLSDEDKALIENLSAEHRTQWVFRAVKLDPGVNVEAMEMFNQPGRIHPLVWKHGSGRRSLVLGWTAGAIPGMDDAVADALLRRLIAHAEQPQYVYQHQWQPGDAIVWDNTGTMHRVLHYDKDSGRRLHRVTLVGEEPLAA
jgi:alpha-ketoglutarate-dependent taurine dioxygenase